MRDAKESYRKKVEQKLKENNMREIWDSVKTITECETSYGAEDGDIMRVNQFNHFFKKQV